MNRNTESHFSKNPTIGVSRSKFDRSFTHKTTFNAADLIPVFVDTTIMPGDTVKMRTSEVVRMATPICPVMDNANLDLYFFFVPYRLIWNHWKAFMGENETAPWIQNTQYTIPMVRFGSFSSENRNAKKGSLADYMGYPVTSLTGGNTYDASALPFRAYCLIWNEFFRDQNLQNPVNIKSAVDATEWSVPYDYPAYNEVASCANGGGKPLRVAKYHDYFTSCLPGTQKGPAITLPLGTSSAPVLMNSLNDTDLNGKQFKFVIGGANQTGGATWTEDPYTGTDHVHEMPHDTPEIYGGTHKAAYADSATLYTDLSSVIGATVTQLRQAFAIQKFYEKQALGGSRYIEMIKTHFDVTNPDFRMQRPEYLGGKRIPINMNQVVQNTPTDGTTTPLGTTGAFSVTSDRDEMFTHSFTEHGILMGLCAVRTVHTYQQGLNRQFSKKNFTDFYFPVFANLSNQAVLNKEIYLQGNSVVDSDGKIIDDQAFGYQEAWATERYFPDIVTGEMRSNYAQSLDIWHYADYYTQKPTLGDKWIEETKDNINRTLAVQSHDQFIADFYFAAVYTRPMPLYSIPGLIDHH